MVLFVLVASACGSDSDTDTGDSSLAPMEISELLEADVPITTSVIGYVVISDTGARLCEALAESFPPQCGGSAVDIANPDVLTVAFEEEQGVQWTDPRVQLDGTYDGSELTLDNS